MHTHTSPVFGIMADLQETWVPMHEPSALEDTSSNSEVMFLVQNSIGSPFGAARCVLLHK